MPLKAAALAAALAAGVADGRDDVARRMHRYIRDSGLFAALGDGGAVAAGLHLLAARPKIARELWHARTFQYGPTPTHSLDVLDAEAAPGSPVLVFVHGGAWGSGSKLLYRAFCAALARRGCVVVVVGYPVWPATDAEGQMAAVRAALDWVRDRLAREAPAADPRRVFVAGHSSGAHLVLQSALAEALAGPGRQRADVAGLVLLSAPFHIGDHYEFERGRGVHQVSPMKPAAGGRAHFSVVSPTFVAERLLAPEEAEALPPVLVLHGDSDDTVPLASSARLVDALAGAGARVALRCVRGLGHAEAITDVMLRRRTGRDVLGSVEVFVRTSRL